jgi:hypothetical protein
MKQIVRVNSNIIISCLSNNPTQVLSVWLQLNKRSAGFLRSMNIIFIFVAVADEDISQMIPCFCDYDTRGKKGQPRDCPFTDLS